jgi:HEAT repeat protein
VTSAATTEEAEIVITRLLAEWELRQRHVPAGDSLEALAARDRVIQQLATLGPAAMEPLMYHLRSITVTPLALGRAAIAARALGRMGDFRAIPPLLAVMYDRRVGAEQVRAAAVAALGELKAEAAASLYERALVRQSEDNWQAETERLSTLHLETLVEALKSALHDPAPEVREAAASACIDLCLAAPPPALLAEEQVPSSARDAVVPKEASQTLAQAVEPLSKALQDEDAGVRVAAATALGWLGDERAAGALARCLKDPDQACRIAAAMALGMLRSPAALKPLARALGDVSPEVRRQAAESLALLGDPITVDLLADALNDEEESLEVRAAAARALGQSHLPQALPVLLALLDEPQPTLRLAAVEALGRMKFGRTYRQVAPLVWNDPDRAVRHAAARALAQLAEARQGRARWRLRLALRVERDARQDALTILEGYARNAHHALRE